MFIHCVYFWLKGDLPPGATEQFTEGLRALTAIGDVERGYYGPPAATERPVVERGYDYGLVIVCADAAAHEAYQEHPIHDRFRETCAGFWKEVRVYDVDASARDASPERPSER